MLSVDLYAYWQIFSPPAPSVVSGVVLRRAQKGGSCLAGNLVLGAVERDRVADKIVANFDNIARSASIC